MMYRPDFLEKLECGNQSLEQCIWIMDIYAKQYANDHSGLELTAQLIVEIFHPALLTAHCVFGNISSSSPQLLLKLLLHSFGLLSLALFVQATLANFWLGGN